MSDLDEFIESVKADVPDGPYHSREEFTKYGCEGSAEYSDCAAMSEDYKRLVREHATMLATIENAQKLGRYLDDAYREATT